MDQSVQEKGEKDYVPFAHQADGIDQSHQIIDMKILFISYWGVNEGLSQSTVIPHLEILHSMGVNRIALVSLERSKEDSYLLPNLPNLEHYPIKTDKTRFRLINKLYDFLILPARVLRIAQKIEADVVICRSSLAGYFGLYLRKKLKIRLIVESFEPHADYMMESDVWNSSGLSYRLAKMWEKRLINEADYLITVSENYKSFLIDHGALESKLSVAPCAVDLDKFQFSKESRVAIRRRLGISDDEVVGIYVGKFGGMYLEIEDACKVFNEADNYYDRFRLIVLSPQSDIKTRIETIFSGSLQVLSVSHNEVPAYLSAADFAFSLQKPGFFKQFLSPIKIGEYWASGLPVVLTHGVGDETDIVEQASVPPTFLSFDLEGNLKVTHIDLELLSQDRSNNEFQQLARKHRSFEIVKKAYQKILIDG